MRAVFLFGKYLHLKDVDKSRSLDFSPGNPPRTISSLSEVRELSQSNPLRSHPSHAASSFFSGEKTLNVPGIFNFGVVFRPVT
jgi:hypothetical protein